MDNNKAPYEAINKITWWKKNRISRGLSPDIDLHWEDYSYNDDKEWVILKSGNDSRSKSLNIPSNCSDCPCFKTLNNRPSCEILEALQTNCKFRLMLRARERVAEDL